MSSGRKTALALIAMSAIAMVAVFQLSRLGGTRATPTERGARPTVTTTPSSTPAPAPTTGSPTQYLIMQGDTITSIARQFGVTAGAIVAANQLADPDQLTVGQALVIPPRPPVQLLVDPVTTTPGVSVRFRLGGAKPEEQVTFTVHCPSGQFTGPPHAAADDGTVTASYTPQADARPGVCTVTGSGDGGTGAQAEFRIDAGPASAG